MSVSIYILFYVVSRMKGDFSSHYLVALFFTVGIVLTTMLKFHLDYKHWTYLTRGKKEKVSENNKEK